MSQSSHPHPPHSQEQQADRFGLRAAALLTSGAAALPHDIGERLRVAREQAVQRRKRPAVVPAYAVVAQAGHSAVLQSPPRRERWWGALGTALPLAALVLGLVGIHYAQNDAVARETAEIDAELLLDELPPAAYTDPGFAQFLKTRAEEGR